MTFIDATILLYLLALSLTVATLWFFSYATEVISLKTDPRSFLLLVGVVVPFLMLLYFGSAFLISDSISERADWLKAMRSELGADWLKVMRLNLSFMQSLVAVVTYVGLSGWLWLRWRNPIAPSTLILGPAIIAAAIILMIVSLSPYYGFALSGSGLIDAETKFSDRNACGTGTTAKSV